MVDPRGAAGLESLRPEAARRDEARERAAAKRVWRIVHEYGAEKAAAEYRAEEAAAKLAGRQPAGLPWCDVDAELACRHATDDRYRERTDIGHKATLDIGDLRLELENKVLDQAERHASRGRRNTRLRPDERATAITEAVKAIQETVDRLASEILDRVLPDRARDPAPTAAVAPPEGTPPAETTPGPPAQPEAPQQDQPAAAAKNPAAAEPTSRQPERYPPSESEIVVRDVGRRAGRTRAPCKRQPDDAPPR